jgi:hypothetical protein
LPWLVEVEWRVAQVEEMNLRIGMMGRGALTNPGGRVGLALVAGRRQMQKETILSRMLMTVHQEKVHSAVAMWIATTRTTLWTVMGRKVAQQHAGLVPRVLLVRRGGQVGSRIGRLMHMCETGMYDDDDGPGRSEGKSEVDGHEDVRWVADCL